MFGAENGMDGCVAYRDKWTVSRPWHSRCVGDKERILEW